MAIVETTKLGLSKIDDDDAGSKGDWGQYQRQDLDRLEARLTTQYAGNPNSNVAGYWVGQRCFDTTNARFYFCTTATGVAATSVWTLLEDIMLLGVMALKDEVEFTDIEDVSAVSLLGNPTGVAGAVSEITLGTGLSFSGTTLVGEAAASRSIAILRDEKASGSSGGASLNADWTTRVLNTESFDPSNIVTLAANAFTPIAGNYVMRCTSMFQGCGGTRMRLLPSSGAVISVGPSMHMGAAATSVPYTFVTYFTADGVKSYTVQYRAEDAVADGLGQATGLTVGNEVFTELLLERIGV